MESRDASNDLLPDVDVKKILVVIGMTAGGWIGWELGAFVSTFTAFVTSVIGTGLGLYVVNRFSHQYLP